MAAQQVLTEEQNEHSNSIAARYCASLTTYATSEHGGYGITGTVGFAAQLGNSWNTDLLSFYSPASGELNAAFHPNTMIGWASGSYYHLVNPDTGMTRDAAGVIDFGNGGFKDKSATLQAGVINLQAAQSTETGATSGNMICSQPFQGATYKKIVINLAALLGAASYTFPTPFTVAPDYFIGGAAAGATVIVSTTTVTVTGATSTGVITLEGF
jgi:hypothetical protein